VGEHGRRAVAVRSHERMLGGCCRQAPRGHARPDWANTSRSHESWFLGDGVHLTYDGALGMARLLHASLVDALVSPLVVPKPHLPIAHPGQRYTAQLIASGGVVPYRWRVTSGKLAAGFPAPARRRITGDFLTGE